MLKIFVYKTYDIYTDDGETPDRVCSITGAPDSVQKAQQMIEELLQNSNVSSHVVS